MRIPVRGIAALVVLVLFAASVIAAGTTWGMGGAFLFGTIFGAAAVGSICRIGLKQALDQALTAKAEADRANIAKSKFLAAASHDLRQPVQSLALYMAILEQRVAGTILAQLAAQMGQAVEALNSLLTSVLDVSRLDAGVIITSITKEPVHELVGRLAHEYELHARAKGLRLVARIDAAVALTDVSLLERIIRNLLENALRYTERGGILIRLRPCHGRIRLDVVDTGLGIGPEHRSAIFEEFFQVGNCARDRAQGLGLGLSIVARLSKLIGGDVAVASRIGRGSRFTITLPTPEGETQTAAANGGASLRIPMGRHFRRLRPPSGRAPALANRSGQDREECGTVGVFEAGGAHPVGLARAP